MKPGVGLRSSWDTTVGIAPGPKSQELEVNRIEEPLDGKSQVRNLASPFFEGGRVYYRSAGHLFCIGER